jgi:hypothetical protein
MCAFCAGRRRIRGLVEYVIIVPRDDTTSATSNGTATATMQGSGIPCPACEPAVYGPIVRVDIWRD